MDNRVFAVSKPVVNSIFDVSALCKILDVKNYFLTNLGPLLRQSMF